MLSETDAIQLQRGGDWAALELSNLRFVAEKTLFQSIKICAHALHTLNYYHQNTNQYDKVIQYQNQLLQIAEQYQKAIPKAQLTTIYYNKGFAAIRVGEPEIVEEALLKAIEHSTIKDKKHTYFYNSYHQLGIAYYSQLKYDKALEFSQKALDLLDENEDVYALASLYRDMAGVYERQLKYEKAENYFNRSLQLLEKVNDAEYLKITHMSLAILYFNWRKHGLAEKHNLIALEHNKYLNNAFHESLVVNNLGLIYFALASASEEKPIYYQKAKDCFHQAISVLITLNMPYNQGEVYHNLGNLAMAQKDYQSAEEYWFKAISSYNSPPKTADIQFNLGELYLLQKQYKKARESFEIALRLYKDADFSTSYEIVFHRLS